MFKKLLLTFIASLSLVGCVQFQSDTSKSDPATTTDPAAGGTTTETTDANARRGKSQSNTSNPNGSNPPSPTEEPAQTPENAPGGARSGNPSTSQVEVLTAVGVGDRVPDPTISTSRRFTDDPVADYSYYGGPADLPFLKVENGLLIGISTSVADWSYAEYNFIIAYTDQTPQQMAEAAIAPIQKRYPNSSIATATTQSDTITTYGIDVSPPDPDQPSWKIGAAVDSDQPGAAIIKVSVSRKSPRPPTGEAMFAPCCSPEATAFLSETGLPLDKATSSRTDNGSQWWSGDQRSLGFEFSIDDASSAAWVDRLRPLTAQGWELDESQRDYAVFRRDMDSIQILHNNTGDPVTILATNRLDLQ